MVLIATAHANVYLVTPFIVTGLTVHVHVPMGMLASTVRIAVLRESLVQVARANVNVRMVPIVIMLQGCACVLRDSKERHVERNVMDSHLVLVASTSVYVKMEQAVAH